VRLNNRVLLPSGSRLSPDWISKNLEIWQKTLRRIHDSGEFLSCLCSGEGHRRLDVVHRGERFFLRKAPKSGPLHDHECSFYEADESKSGLGGYEAGVVQYGESGLPSVRLEVGLSRINREEGSETEPSSPHKPGARRPAMSILGLAHFLWEQSRWNVWSPGMAGKRTGTKFGFWMRAAAKEIIVSRKHLDGVLVILAPKDGESSLHYVIQDNSQVLEQTIKSGGRAIFLGEISHLGLCGDQSISFITHGVHRVQPVFSEKISNKVRKSIGGHLRAIRALPDGSSARVLGMAVAGLEGKTWVVGACRAMITTPGYIPVESSHEWALARHLEESGRRFLKPLRFDAESDWVFPDFVLLDTEHREYPMEVYGMATADYLERKAEKEAYYQRVYGTSGHWLWDATKETQWPELPPKVYRKPPEQE
jgi:hypothetical protein